MADTTSKGGLSRGFFIAASTVQFLTFAAHTVAQLAGPDEPKNDQQKQLMEMMRTVRIELPGAQWATADLLNGFSWHFAISLLALGAIGLIVACGDPRGRRVFAGAAAVFMAVFTVNSVIHLFIIPTAFMGLGAMLYAASFLTGPRQAA